MTQDRTAMTMLLSRRTSAGATPPAAPTRRSRTDRPPTAPTPALSTATLLRLAERDDAAVDLVPVGIAVHVFTEPLASAGVLTVAELHRATTVLTKQVKHLFTEDDRLATIHRLVTDPDRRATPDGRTAAMLCGRAWPSVAEVATERSGAAVDGAVTFGETAILRLAATRAASPTCTWWGTNGWLELVERWISDGPRKRGVVTSLVRAPELVSDDILESVLDR